MRSVWAVGWVLALLGAGGGILACRPSTSGNSTASSSAAEASGAASVAASPASAPPADPPVPYVFDRGCAGDIEESASVQEQLDELGRRCAPGLGPMDLTDGQVDLSTHACIRIGIVSSRPGQVVDVVVRDGKGRTLLGARSRTPTLVPEGGPFCVEEGGKHRVEVATVGAGAEVGAEVGAGADVAVRVWGATGE